MLKDFPAIATLAVKDLSRAKAFYGETLGLDLSDQESGVLTFTAGDAMVFVYQSGFAGTNQATAATWSLPDIAPVVAALHAKGVVFEHYDSLPGLTRQGDLYEGRGMKVAWFKDPDGNILSLVSGG